MAIYKVISGTPILFADVAKSGSSPSPTPPTPGQKTLVSIAITTPPTTTTYDVGDTLDLTGMVVTATYSDFSTDVVTSAISTTPANGAVLTVDITTVEVRYTESGIMRTANQSITVQQGSKTLYVATPPNKTIYNKGDALNLNGMVVKFVDGGTETDVTNQVDTSPVNGFILTLSETSVDIVYQHDGVTYTTTQPISVYGIYGASWDGSSSPAWTRTDDAENMSNPSPAISNGNGNSPFDNLAPWNGMNIVEDEAAGSLVSIPKFYYKWTKTNDTLKLQISPAQFTGSLVSPAHADRGDGKGERDVVYVGRYYCNNNYKSETGSAKKQTGIATFRSGIHQLGSDIWQWDYAMYWTIAMLYLVEYAHWDSQTKIGAGIIPQNDCGQTDSMLYHTGTAATTRGGVGHIQYRHIEGLWSYNDEFVDGIYFKNANAYAIKNPANFSNTSGGALIGQRIEGRGYTVKSYDVSQTSGFEYILLPSEEYRDLGYDYSVYNCDMYMTGESGYWGNSLRVGLSDSSQNSNGHGGLFSQNSFDQDSFGSRLMKLP